MMRCFSNGTTLSQWRSYRGRLGRPYWGGSRGEPISLSLGPLLAHFYGLADPSPASIAYIRAHELDLEEVTAHAGCLAVTNCTFGRWCFTFDNAGEPSVVIEVYDDDDETPIDLVAWPAERPQTFATALGFAAVMGAAGVVNPASWAFGQRLRVFRTPLRWSQARCPGVVILDYKMAPSRSPKPLAPLRQKTRHTPYQLRNLLCRPLVGPRNIVAPRAARRAA